MLILRENNIPIQVNIVTRKKYIILLSNQINQLLSKKTTSFSLISTNSKV